MFDTLQAQHIASQALLLESAAHAELAKAYLLWALVGFIVWLAILLPIALHLMAMRRREAIQAVNELFKKERADITSRIRRGLHAGGAGDGSSQRG